MRVIGNVTILTNNSQYYKCYFYHDHYGNDHDHHHNYHDRHHSDHDHHYYPSKVGYNIKRYRIYFIWYFQETKKENET